MTKFFSKLCMYWLHNFLLKLYIILKFYRGPGKHPKTMPKYKTTLGFRSVANWILSFQFFLIISWYFYICEIDHSIIVSSILTNRMWSHAYMVLRRIYHCIHACLYVRIWSYIYVLPCPILAVILCLMWLHTLLLDC